MEEDAEEEETDESKAMRTRPPSRASSGQGSAKAGPLESLPPRYEASLIYTVVESRFKDGPPSAPLSLLNRVILLN